MEMKPSFNDYIILMADVIDSREYNLFDLMQKFKAVTTKVNLTLKECLLSPIVITLGDEFQCVAKDKFSASKILWNIEEELVRAHLSFKLRYKASLL